MKPDQHDTQWMRRAIYLASENVRTGTGGPFAAVIVRDGELVAEGANQVLATHDPTAHGEIVAIRKACRALGNFRLEGCTLYSSAEPCPMCLAAISWAHLSRFFYGNTAQDAAEAGFDDARLYREARLPAAERAIPGTPLLREEAGASFALWRQSPLRVDY
ncbi:nucleoside deaminase [Acidipila sp. EB88]|uniref:nucleoside deaminase n=1 Tax=Acidipila sp. EB88 TaxID=2305226 RepID=UPI000F5D7B4F|nr:nucleoside deaminase [Acidipila sp. EB88]RRA47313.1 nucleoside deaminase [Acidipila sp. EB88]